MLATRTFARRLAAALALALAARDADAQACADGIPRTATLGIGLLQCVGGSCTVNARDGAGRAHDFSTEPRVWRLDAPAAGVITGIGRIWADGKLMDVSGVTWRWYPGDEAQTADPFIAANRLWVSAKPMSKYMRTIFTNEVAAWDQAMEEGVTIAAHVASFHAGSSRCHFSRGVTRVPTFGRLSTSPLASRRSRVMYTDPMVTSRPVTFSSSRLTCIP